MKNLFKIKTTIILFFGLALMTSCTDTKDSSFTTGSSDNTITGRAIVTPELSILVSALKKCNLASTLQGTGPFTVFAPTNDAFNVFLQSKGYANIDAVPTPMLTQILLNHVLNGAKNASKLVTKTYVKTLAIGSTSATNKLDMFILKIGADDTIQLNGVANVLQSDINASNGIIHIVGAVVALPTLATHAVANPLFNKLESIVTSPAQSAVLAVLTGNTAYTIFAPTDAAFIAFNTELTTTTNPAGLDGVSAANVTKVLQYHVITGNKLAIDLVAGTVTTALTQTFSLALGPDATITDVNGRISNLTPANVQCSNGVLHILDKVLLPTL